MKESIWMRVLICKVHCPFICFCKPSAAAAHLYSSGALKLENTPPQLPSNSTVVSVSDTSDLLYPASETTQNSHSDGQLHVENAIKSCIRKAPAAPDAAQKKRVQWIDSIGKKLEEIREFESCETGDTDNEEDSKGCMCIIL